MTTFKKAARVDIAGAAIAWSRAVVACSADWTLTMGVMTTDLQGRK